MTAEVPWWGAALPVLAWLRNQPAVRKAFGKPQRTNALSGPSHVSGDVLRSVEQLAACDWLAPTGALGGRDPRRCTVELHDTQFTVIAGNSVQETFTPAQLVGLCETVRSFAGYELGPRVREDPRADALSVALAATGAMPQHSDHASTAQTSGLAGEAGLLDSVRAAHGRLAEARGSQPRQVSVVLATRRERMWPQILQMLAAQRGVALQVVCAVHGLDGGDERLRKLLGSYDMQAVVLPVDKDISLGGVLNLALERCDGELVAKMDDDDWYAPDHLLDLAQAMGYANADMVGKGAELVAFPGRSWMIRRFVGSAFSTSTALGGATLMLNRESLNDHGGFADLSLGEDRHLIETMHDAGGSLYRIHGHGYAAVRRADATWDSSLWRFLRQADCLVPVRDLEVAGFGPTWRDLDHGLLA